MKTSKDPRHLKRKNTVQELFAWNFNRDKTQISSETLEIVEKVEDLDPLIQAAAPNRPLEQINRIDLSILRLAIFELVQKDIPFKVVVDEAVELAKEFGAESSPSFVNGALGAIIEVLEDNK